MLDFFRQKIEEHLTTLIPDHSPYFPKLYEGGRYALLAPGKRIRPLLTVGCAQMLDQNSLTAALAPASALELVHTYSLIHDDLPCMDNDDFRRGLPTLHRVYSEGHAVLVGDYLLTYAFEVIATAPYLSAEQRIALLHCLARAAGSEGMLGGQVMDIEGSPHVHQMHSQKTAALFTAAIDFGAIIGQAPQETKMQLHQFGWQFGQLFQMVDDLLDEDHPLGKEQAQASATALFHRAMALLSTLPCDTTTLKSLTELVFSQLPG